MPGKDGTGPDGKGPKRINQGVPTPKRIGRAGGKRTGMGRSNSNRGRGKQIRRNV